MHTYIAKIMGLTTVIPDGGSGEGVGGSVELPHSPAAVTRTNTYKVTSRNKLNFCGPKLCVASHTDNYAVVI